MEHPKATWNDFSTPLLSKDVSDQISTSFVKNEEQNKVQMASLRQELKNRRTYLKEHRVNAVERNQKPNDPIHKERQSASLFCGYCRTIGQTPSYCTKNIRDEEVKKLPNEATVEKKVTFTHDYNKRRGLSHGSGRSVNRIDDNGALTSTPQPKTRRKFRPINQSYNNFSRIRPLERRDYSVNNNDRYNDYKIRPPYQSNQDQSRKWGKNNNYSPSPSTSQGSSFTDFRRQPRRNSPNSSVLNQFENQDPSKNIPYDNKFPTYNNGDQPNVVRFTTTDDSINELSELSSRFWTSNENLCPTGL